jgi:hypothetical protein
MNFIRRFFRCVFGLSSEPVSIQTTNVIFINSKGVPVRQEFSLETQGPTAEQVAEALSPWPPLRRRPPKPPGCVWSRNPKLNESLTRKFGDPEPMYFDTELWSWMSGQKP